MKYYDIPVKYGCDNPLGYKPVKCNGVFDFAEYVFTTPIIYRKRDRYFGPGIASNICTLRIKNEFVEDYVGIIKKVFKRTKYCLCWREGELTLSLFLDNFYNLNNPNFNVYQIILNYVNSKFKDAPFKDYITEVMLNPYMFDCEYNEGSIITYKHLCKMLAVVKVNAKMIKMYEEDGEEIMSISYTGEHLP